VWQGRTLERIAATCGGWQPDLAYFLDTTEPPHVFKERVLQQLLFPDFGADPNRYVGLESNAATRKRYARNGVLSAPVPVDAPPTLSDDVWMQVMRWNLGDTDRVLARYMATRSHQVRDIQERKAQISLPFDDPAQAADVRRRAVEEAEAAGCLYGPTVVGGVFDALTGAVGDVRKQVADG
jgi:chorismate mutase